MKEEKQELAEELERDRPVVANVRPTGRVSRTGTQGPTPIVDRSRGRRVDKWVDRNNPQPEDPERGGPAIAQAKRG